MKIFSGSSNPKLSKKFAEELNVKLGKIEISRFSNGECSVWVREKITNGSAIVLQSFSLPPDEHIIEFCLIVDALRRSGIQKIIAVIPWMGYSKQDKVFRSGEPLSVKVIAKIIQAVKIDHLITLDLHNPSIIGFFDCPVSHLSAQSLFIDYFQKNLHSQTIVVAPDAGSIKISTKFAQKLRLPVAYIDKERNLATGKVNIHGISGKVKNKNIIIVDDMISTGSTLLETADYLQKIGVHKIFVAITHHLFVPGVTEKLIKSSITKLLITDTISPSAIFKSEKLKILSVSSLLAAEIQKLTA